MGCLGWLLFGGDGTNSLAGTGQTVYVGCGSEWMMNEWGVSVLYSLWIEYRAW